MPKINSLYELIKEQSIKKGRPLKIVCDWDECLKPLNPWIGWKIAKNRGVDDGINFKEFFLEYWKCLRKVRTDTGSHSAPKEIAWESGEGTKIEKYGKWRNDNHKLFQIDYANIKKTPDFQKIIPCLSIAEGLLNCLKEDLISKLVVTSNWHMKLKDAELFHPIHGDERKNNQFDLTFGLFPNTELRLVKTSPDKSGPFRWEWIRDNHPDFDIFIDDSSVYIERTNKLFPDRVFVIPDYKSTEYLQAPNIYHVKQGVSDLKDEDFSIAALELKTKQLEKELKVISESKNSRERERESLLTLVA